MILKLLLIGAVIYIVYIMFFKKRTVPNQRNTHNRQQKNKPQANEMVECSNCSVYVEISEAILSNGKYYCCDACLKEAK